MMKRLFCLLLAVCMAVSLCACRKDSEKVAENNTPSSDGEVSAPAEIIPTPDEQETQDEQQTPEEPEQTQTSADGVDVDLTVLSSTMVYSEVYNMLYFYPEDYYGKNVKMTGQFNVYQWVDESGIVADMPVAYACIISDATACCAEGVEFVLEGDYTYPDDYPELGTEITVIGEFQSYEENGVTWYHLVNARMV
jgi:uncharacterized membrane protein YcgQ (UPF0703/DUF1980 family)